MAEILENVCNSNVKVEYDDPYSSSPFFSEKSLSAKIENSPIIVLQQEGDGDQKGGDISGSGSVSMDNSVQELQETNSVTSEGKVDDHEVSDSSENLRLEDATEICYENFSNVIPVDADQRENSGTELDKSVQGSDASSDGGNKCHLEVSQDDVHDYDEPEGAIYDAPWDLGALQKGLEEKFKMSSYADASPKDPAVPTSKTNTPRMNAPSNQRSSNRNSPEMQGSAARQAIKGKSPSRKSEPTSSLEVAEFLKEDQQHQGSALQKRPLPSFPASQSSVKSQNFPSSEEWHHHPMQRKAVPVMGGGSVGRGHQLKSQDWRPLEDYDIPWDNRHRDLMSTFSQDSLRISMKNAHHASLAEKIESRLPMEREWWYHGPITRQEAEKRLRNEREGSYLIRNSESNRLDYSLSIKSSTGCIHLKIVPSSEGRFILGQFSQPFLSVAQMIQHYTVNKLPIKGAEHMSLTFPVGH